MSQLTPEEYAQLLSMGGENTDLDMQMQMQMAQAKAMRQGNAPQMKQAGRVAVAPHWLELLGGLARERAGQIQQDKATASGKQRTANTGAQNALVLRGILGNRKPEPAPFAFGSGYEEGR